MATSTRGRLLLRDRNAMRNRAGDKPEAFDRAARFPGKRDDQRIIHHRRQVARNNGVRRDLHRFGAHYFAKARQLHSHDPANGFWSYIARPDSGSASGQNQPATLFRKGTNRFPNFSGIIRNYCFAQNLPPTFLSEFPERRSAKIFVIARARSIRNRDYAANDLHLRKIS